MWFQFLMAKEQITDVDLSLWMINILNVALIFDVTNEKMKCLLRVVTSSLVLNVVMTVMIVTIIMMI